jgi:hypothetical protein
MVVQQTMAFGGVQVAGVLTHGELPAEGSRVSILQEGKRPITAIVSGASRLQEPSRVHVGLRGVNAKDVLPGARIATEPKLLEEPVPPELRPTPPENPPSEADAYADYNGPPLEYEWLPISGVDFDINVHLVSEPTDEQRAALERAVQSWYDFGVNEGWPGALSAESFVQNVLTLGREGQGHLHGLRGPIWQRRLARWRVDSGSAPADTAASDLAHRLAGWLATWRCPAVALRLGLESS